MLRKLDLQEMVMTIVGSINPIGEHNADTQRLENLKVLTELVDSLLFDINRLSEHANRHEASIKAIGKHAAEFMQNVRDN